MMVLMTVLAEPAEHLCHQIVFLHQPRHTVLPAAFTTLPQSIINTRISIGLTAFLVDLDNLIE